MGIKEKILLAKLGTDWLTDGLNEVEIKQNRFGYYFRRD